MTSMRLRAALLCASLLFAAAPSHANGRFPLSQRLFQDQNNPDHLFLSATFGLLLTHDRGANWYHVCEGALSPDQNESDILFELLPDGAMLASLVHPLVHSTDCGCAWDPVLGEAEGESITDIAKAGGNSVVALARTISPVVFRVERSNDGGQSFGKVSDLPVRLEAFTIDVAPSDPMRLYVSVMLTQDIDAGIAESTPALLVSEDGGATWSAPRAIPGGTFNDQPFIAAVHPDDADTLFVRTYAWSPAEDGGPDVADDALFVTSDAGLTFREVLRKHAKLHGFALSPDGSTVLVGYGDPQQAARDVYPEDVGIYRANTADLVGATVVAEPFTQALNAAVSCLTWNEHGLYACFDTMVGVSADGSIPSMTSDFTPILHNADVRGPLACNSATCLPEWQEGREDIPAVCERIAAECDVDATAHVLACGGGMGGTGGSGMGGSGMGGSGSSGGDAAGGSTSAGSGPLSGAGGTATSGASSGGRAGSATNAGQAGESSDDDSGSSCGCRSPRPSGHAGAFAALALLTLLGLRKHRHTAKRERRDRRDRFPTERDFSALGKNIDSQSATISKKHSIDREM